MNEKIKSVCLVSDNWISEFEENGLALFDRVVSSSVIKLLKSKLSKAIIEEQSLRRSSDDESLVVCCPYYDDFFIEVAEQYLFSIADRLLGKDSILYSYSNSSIPSGAGNFSSEMHVERYYFSGYLESIGIMVLLDDFNENNGGTLFLLGSHLSLTKPSSKFFYQDAKRLIAKSGSVLIFNPRLWHSGGINSSAQRRDALTVGFCRPYMKQRLNYPYIFKRRSLNYSKKTKQKLGFYAQSPKSIEEFYSQDTLGWSAKKC